MNKKERERNKQEIELYETKWFDYRRGEPDVATMRFLFAYGKAMETYNDQLGHTRYRHILKAFADMRLESLRDQAQFKQLASLRRWADKHGMPYELFWSYATEAHLKLGFDKTFITVFGNASIKAKVLDMWEHWKEVTVVRSSDPFFRAANFTGYAQQCEYYDYLIDSILRRYTDGEAARRLARLVNDGELDQNYLVNAVDSRSKAKEAA